MAASVHAQSELGSKLPRLKMAASQLAFHPQDVRTPPTMTSDSHLGQRQGAASLDHLLAHLESSKQNLEHQVQQLLQENRLSKSAKKEQQWQMEGERLHSKLDSMSVALAEKEECIRRLEKELRDARASVQQMQSRCREAEKEKERGMANVQADLEEAQTNFQNLEREYKLKHEVAEKQRRALENLADKVEKQKEFFQNHLEDARRKLEESEEREQKFELVAQLANQQISEKDRQLKSLRDAHEKLLAVQKGKKAEERQEVREVIQVLESTHAKCEEQKALIKELEQELGKIRKEAHQLDARVAVAEADASSKAAMLEKVQLELKNTASHVVPLSKAKAQIEELKAEVEALKRTLQDRENTLSEESAVRFKAECALNEYKVREKSLLKIEQDGKALQEEVKWRNEQFESLEEAHNRMRDQFHEGRNMWASERASMLRDIEVMTENLQSRDITIHELRSQLKVLNQSLAHEENCRKLLEFQLADAKAGMESVSADFLSAQSILETLRENSKKELSFLKDTLRVKDNQLKELNDKQKQIDRGQKELLQLEANVLGCDEEREILTRRLNDAETVIAAKQVEMKEMEIELDRTRTLAELLRTSLAEAEEKHLEEKSSLEQAIASLAASNHRVMELEAELERLRAAVDGVGESNTAAEAREKQELVGRIEHLSKQCAVKDAQLNDLLDQIERERQVIGVLEARCSESEQELSKQLALVDHAREEVIVWKLNAQAHKERAQVLDASLSAEVATKNASLQEIKDSLYELTVLCKGGAQAATTQTLRISSLEQKLQQQEMLRDGMDGRLVSLTGKVERIAQGVAHLKTELHSLEDASKLTKTGFETRLRAVEGLFSTSCAELKEVSLQVRKMNAERLSLVKSLDMKEGDLEVLKGENQCLNAERTRLEASANALEERLLKLAREAENSKAIIDSLNENLKAAEERMASRSGELHELHERLQESESRSKQLLSVAGQAQTLEDKLRETETIVHDREQRLAASEWTVQQLASEIAKSKSYLTQKEKDEVASKDRLSRMETQLRERERELMELQCDLENAVKTSNERHNLVQQLTCSKEELGHVLDLTKRALDERTATLGASEAEVKRLLEIQRLTEEALETCKERLENEVKTNIAREKDMNRLCEDVERATQESRLADVQVKDLEERLKCLEMATDARLESYERKVEKGEADLSEYKENCAGLLDLIEKKDAVIHELEVEVDRRRKELAQQVMLTEQGEQELAFVSQQLQSKTKMYTDLKVEIATTDGIIKELDLQKRGLEEELNEVKSSLSAATQALQDKALEIEEHRRNIERVERLAAQQGDAHAVKVKELQDLSHAVEERDSNAAKLEAALNQAHDDLQTAYEIVSTKEGEKCLLSVRLSEMESLVEKGKSQISKLQASLEAETERVWHQVAARNEIETELDAWKAKADALQESGAELEASVTRLQAEVKEWKGIAEHTENLNEMELDAWKGRVASLTDSNATMRAEFESSMKKLQMEVEEWKEIAENTQFLNAELDKSIQAVQESVTGWEKVVTSLVDEGDVTKQHLEFLLKQVHEEFRYLQADLASSKDLMSITCQEGISLKAEFLTFVKDNSQVQMEGVEEREQQLQDVVSDLRRELNEAELQSKDWRQKAEEWESFNGILEKAFLDLERALLECQSDITSIDKAGRNMKLDIQLTFQSLRQEVDEAKSEMLGLQEVAVQEAKQIQRAQLEYEGCVAALQAEVEAWKEKAASATEEALEMKAQFEGLLKSLKGELKTWKQLETLSREERQSTKTQQTASNIATLEGSHYSDIFTPNYINPFHQEDEGCSSGLDSPSYDDAAKQLNGWKCNTSSVAKEGRKLTRQFRTSFKHIQFELESRKPVPAPKFSRHASFVHKHDDTGLEELVKALQEEAVVIKAELADWKNKATSAAQETATVREDLERTISKLKAEVEGWKDRTAMSAGQRIVARRQLDDFAKQVKSLNTELQKWKDVATEANEGATRLQTFLESVQKENAEVRGELNEWMQKALELNCRIKDLEADVERWKQVAGTQNKDSLRMQELEHLRAEVDKWKTAAATAEEEGKSAKMELLDTLGKFEDELEVMSSNSIGECGSAGGRSLREEDVDCSPSGRFSKELRHAASEVEDWKNRAAVAEKEHEDMRQRYEETVKELHLEVEAWKKSAECIAEGGRHERDTLEKRLKGFQVKGRDITELVELQTELENWKTRAGEAAHECASLRDAHENAIKELQLELTQWKAKSETAAEEAKAVKADLEKVVQDLEHQVHVWKQKAEKALEGVKKTQEYEDLIKALEEELCLWTQRTEEGKALQLQLEKERAHLKESLTATQNELKKWKDKAADVTTSIQSLQEVDDSNTELEPQLRKWRSKANDGELLELQLKRSLAETQTELQEWKHKAAEYCLAAESLKEELDLVIEEGRLEKEELRQSTIQLESELSLRAQECLSLQTQLGNSSSQLQIWEEKAKALTQSMRYLMEEFDLTVEEGEAEKHGFHNAITALKSSVLAWKEKAAENESTQLDLKTTLVETQTELEDWKDRAAAVAVATKSLKGEIDCILNDNRLQKEKLCNTINQLEVELLEWKSRAQEGVAVQLQLEKALSEMKEKAAAAAAETQALKDQLDSTIAESSSEVHQLCTAITGLEAELSDLKGKTNGAHSLQIQGLLTETQSQLQESQGKARDAALMTDLDLRNSTNDLETELCQWKEKAQEGELLHQQMRTTLTETQRELQDIKEKMAALTAQLSTQKQNEASLQQLNQQLEADLVQLREEALSRKRKMTQILTQLEGTSNSQKALQNKLHTAQHRLLGNENHRSQFESAKTFPVDSDCISSPDTPCLLNSHHQRSQSESPDFKADMPGGSVKNPAADQLRQELSSLKSLVSRLEHVRRNDGEQSQESGVVGDESKIESAEESIPSASLFREDVKLDTDINGAQRRDASVQKQVESSRANQELVHTERKPIRSHSAARFKVLADVNGNSPRVPPCHDKLQLGGVCPPATPDSIPFSRLRRTTSGM